MQEMNDTEFLRMVGQLYEYALSRENDDDYILNMPQYLKLVEAQAFFTRLAEANDGTVETVRLSPRERCAGLEAQFLVLDLKPGDLPGFFRVLQYSTGLCLEAQNHRRGLHEHDHPGRIHQTLGSLPAGGGV